MRRIMKIVVIYDNGGETVDRYTVYYDEITRGTSLNEGLSMSSDPYHPLGVGCHTNGMLGTHNGKEIEFSDLPLKCQKLVNDDLKSSI